LQDYSANKCFKQTFSELLQLQFNTTTYLAKLFQITDLRIHCLISVSTLTRQLI